jgi:hypothetical protein
MMPAGLQFTCPECGSHKFGSTCDGGAAGPFPSAEEAQAYFARYAWGHCHGQVRTMHGEKSCHFSWPRSTDAKYFT